MPWELAKRRTTSTICRSYGAHGPLDTNGYKDLAPTEPGFGAAKSPASWASPARPFYASQRPLRLQRHLNGRQSRDNHIDSFLVIAHAQPVSHNLIHRQQPLFNHPDRDGITVRA